MALGVSDQLDLNDVYKQMLSESSSNNLIHAEIEEILTDFKSKISIDGIQEKIRDVEKYDPLTNAEKSIIKYIQKVIDALESLEKVNYSGIITMVDVEKKSESEKEIADKDEEFKANLDKENSKDEIPQEDEKFDFSK